MTITIERVSDIEKALFFLFKLENLATFKKRKYCTHRAPRATAAASSSTKSRKSKKEESRRAESRAREERAQRRVCVGPQWVSPKSWSIFTHLFSIFTHLFSLIVQSWCREIFLYFLIAIIFSMLSFEFDTNIAYEKNKAVAFLFTIGAKALVLQEQRTVIQDALNGLDEEAALKVEIDREERIRCIRRDALSRIQVHKISRSGKLRMLYIKFHIDSYRDGLFTWKSLWRYKKVFVLDKSLEVARAEDVTFSTTQKKDSIVFLRFRNSTRHLTIGFSSKEEMLALLEVLSELLPSAKLPDISR
jgi:hypothetical protein